MSADTPFDRNLRRLRRTRAARNAGRVAYLERWVTEEISERLDAVRRRFDDALIIGPGTGLAAAALGARGIAVAAADAGGGFPGAVQCDEDRLSFGDASFDLILALGVLDTVNDLPGALVLIRRALRPGGLFLGFHAGAGSLPRLREAMLAADALAGAAAPRLHPQIDVRAAGDLLLRAGFALPVADADGFDVHFPDLAALIGDLRAMAGTNLLAARARMPLGRAALAAAEAAFDAARDESGRVAERFEIISLLGWAPEAPAPR